MDTKTLRQKILDLAIRGKLVPQDPNDEPASVLLEKIREEKKQMVKEGKLKAKDIKNDTIIFKGEDNLHYEKFQDGTVKCIEDEIPFDVPDGWEWSRIKNISIIGTGATPLKSNRAYYDNGDIAWVTSAATSDPYITKPTSYITKVALDETNCTSYQPGTLIIAMYGEGKTRGQISELSIQAATNQACAAISLVDGDYHFRAYIKAYFSQSYERLRNKAQGGQQPNLNQSIIAEMLVAIPPIKEVVRLIQYINEMLSNISTIECEKSNLQQVIDETKSRILDMAIRGQLVPQDSTDEPASVLLSRIRSEKEIMIKQGKLKRDKKESIIYKGDDNSYYEKLRDGTINCIDEYIPFDLPATWQWCRLQELFQVSSAKRVLQSEWKKTGVPFYRAREIVKLSEQGYVDNDLFIAQEHYDSLKTEYGVPEEGDIMLSAVGTIGKAYIVKDNDVFYYKDASVICLHKMNAEIDSEYIKLVLESPYMQKLMHDNSNGTTVDTITISTANQYLLPLPPFKEQNEIVRDLDKIRNNMCIIKANLS